ncbi:hypothetical protein, partial [Actinotignum timonense]
MTSVYESLTATPPASPWILQFAGQGTPWRAELDELLTSARLRADLTEVDAAAEEILAPVLPELTVISAGRLDLLGLRGPASAG